MVKNNNRMMELYAVKAFEDNYIWLLVNQNEAVIIDPGSAESVLHFLTEKQLVPVAILITHHHDDHLAGVNELVAQFPAIAVYGPSEVKRKLPAISVNTTSVNTAQSTIHLKAFSFSVTPIPGHTLGHVAYYCVPYLFCGDTLFSGGCGRIFEGTPQQMYRSLKTLCTFPDETIICCAHEYTLNNLQFAHKLLPDNRAIQDELESVKQKRDKLLSTLPTTLSKEKKINLFLNCDTPPVKELIGENLDEWQVFAALRKMKDEY